MESSIRSDFTIVNRGVIFTRSVLHPSINVATQSFQVVEWGRLAPHTFLLNPQTTS